MRKHVLRLSTPWAGEIKRTTKQQEEKGLDHREYLAQLVDDTRAPSCISRNQQKPSLDAFYQLVTLLEISSGSILFPDKLNGESTCRKADRCRDSAHGRKGDPNESTPQRDCKSGNGGCVREVRLRF